MIFNPYLVLGKVGHFFPNEPYVQIDGTALDDTTANDFAGIADKTTWNFTTADTTDPTINSTTPADDATDVDPTADLSITFNENVVKGIGNISIFNSADTLIEAIDVTGGQVTVSGATVTINPTNPLPDLTGCYVQIDVTAIEDTSGNAFVGIADKTAWNFTTEDGKDNKDEKAADPAAYLPLMFDRNVPRDAGPVSIDDLNDMAGDYLALNARDANSSLTPKMSASRHTKWFLVSVSIGAGASRLARALNLRSKRNTDQKNVSQVGM